MGEIVNIKNADGDWVQVTGPAGVDGAGVPAGGSTNQALVKASNTSFDTKWVDLSTPPPGYSAVRMGYANYASGRYYDGRIVGYGTNNANYYAGANKVTAYAIPIPRDLSIDRVSILVPAGYEGAAPAIIRYALYGTMTGTVLGNRIMSGQFTAGTAGLKETTGAWTLPAGVVYAAVGGSSTGTPPRLAGMQAMDLLPLMGYAAATESGIITVPVVATLTLNTDAGWASTIDLASATFTATTAPTVFFRVA